MEPVPEVNLAAVNQGADEVRRDFNAEQFGMGHPDTMARYALPTTTGVAPAPRTAAEINDAATPEYRAVMAKAFGAMHPDTDARYTMPTGLVRPPVNAIKELNLGAGDPFAAFTASAAPPATPNPVPPARVQPEPGPVFETFGRSNPGSLMDQSNTGYYLNNPGPQKTLGERLSAFTEPMRYAFTHGAENIGSPEGDLGMSLTTGLPEAAGVATGLAGFPETADSLLNTQLIPPPNPNPSATAARLRALAGEDPPIRSGQTGPRPVAMRSGPPVGLVRDFRPSPLSLELMDVTNKMANRPFFSTEQVLQFNKNLRDNKGHPGGVQQPMPFSVTSQRPMPRPADLGTPAAVVTQAGSPPGGVQPPMSFSAAATPPDAAAAAPAAPAATTLGSPPPVVTAQPPAATLGSPQRRGAFDPEVLAAAIRNQESGSPAGNYSAIGKPVTRPDGSTDYAYGAYGIMGSNIPQWTQEVLGRAMTPEEFLRDQGAQDAVAKAKLSQTYAKYGNIEDTASVWFSGRPMNNSVDPTSGKSVPSYVDDIKKFYYGQPGTFAGDPLHINKPYEDRNMVGQFMHNRETGKLDKNAILSILSGLGAMASSNSVFPLTALLQGLGGGAQAYKSLEKQASDIALQNAQARREGIIPASETGGPALDIYGDQVNPLLGEMVGSSPALPYSPPKGMETIFSSPQIVQGLQMDGPTVYPNSPAAAATAGDATAAQQGYTAAKGTFTPVMSSFGAAAKLIAQPGVSGAGAFADTRSRVLAAANLFLSSIPGIGPVSLSDLPSDKAIIDKTAAIAAANGQGSNPSVEALLNSLDAQGNANLPPEALASITAQNLVDRQMALEKGDFYQTWSQAQGLKSQNGYPTYVGAEKSFTSTLGQKYNAEKGFLEKIMLAPDQTKKQIDLREQLIHLSSGVAGGLFGDPQTVQAAIKEVYPNAPDDLWKVFFNKGLAE
jgi:hypothetical protein